jgi:hypothetical protein
MEEIERAYRRPLPSPDSTFVRFVYGWHRASWWAIAGFLVIWFAGVTLITGAAAIDVFGHLGWGYHLKDLLGCLFMLVLGSLMAAFFLLIHKLIREYTLDRYGPDPFEKRHDKNVS